VLKRVAADLVPPQIIRRPKQPYRAPDALAFATAPHAAWIADALSDTAVRDAGVFEPRAVAQLWAKCSAAAADAQVSNADNMALVGVLSTQLLYRELVARPPEPAVPPITPSTVIEHIP
jgi:asparagine synthase (glutamine-hydrolysing)